MLAIASTLPLTVIPHKIKSAWKQTISILDNHTDLISSVGILAISTCLLAAKIFKSMPPILSRAATFVYSFGGVIWMNVMVKDLIKNGRDLKYAFERKDFIAVLDTAAKVFIHAANILLTMTSFAACLIGAAGYPQLMLAIFLKNRPLALSSLAAYITTDVRDYQISKKLIADLKAEEEKQGSAITAEKVSSAFITLIKERKIPTNTETTKADELALRILRQLSFYTLQSFEEGLHKGTKKASQDFYDELKVSTSYSLYLTKEDLRLRIDGYLAMGISRALPESIADKGVRWLMSCRYTKRLIEAKVLKKALDRGITDWNPKMSWLEKCRWIVRVIKLP